MSIQAKTQRLYKPEDGTSCRRYILVIDHDIKAVATERFFDTLMQNLLPGDEITVKQFDVIADDMGKSKLLARWDFEVTGLDLENRTVEILPRGDIVTYDNPGLAHIEGETVTLVEETPVVKWNAKAQAHQVLRGDEVIFESKNKDEAKAHAEAA